MPGSYWTEKMQLLGDTTLLLQCRSYQVWRVPLNQATDSIPVGESKTFYCGTRDEGLLVLKPESQQVWQYINRVRDSLPYPAT